jgi:hypothetical protein
MSFVAILKIVPLMLLLTYIVAHFGEMLVLELGASTLCVL